MPAPIPFLARPGVRAGLVLAAVFLAGALTGLAVAREVGRRQPRFPLLERATAADVSPLVARLQRRLDLDDAQAARVRVVLERRQPQLRATWTRVRSTLVAQFDTTLAEVGAVLTPEQRLEFEELLRGRRVLLDSLAR